MIPIGDDAEEPQEDESEDGESEEDESEEGESDEDESEEDDEEDDGLAHAGPSFLAMPQEVKEVSWVHYTCCVHTILCLFQCFLFIIAALVTIGALHLPSWSSIILLIPKASCILTCHSLLHAAFSWSAAT